MPIGRDIDGVPLFSLSEVLDMLQKADEMGLDISSGGDVEKMTVEQLAAAVSDDKGNMA